jgi:hypothetical protein
MYYFDLIEDQSYSEAELLSFSLHNLSEAQNPFSVNKSFPFPNEEQTTNHMSQSNVLFVTNIQDKNLKGRKRKRENTTESKKADRFIHNKYGTDNLLRKIQISFLNLIIQYSNEVLNKFGIQESFIKTNYQIKKI